MGKNQHVVPYQAKWAVRGEGNKKVTSTHDTQAEAIERGRQIAINQRSEVVIHHPAGLSEIKTATGGILTHQKIKNSRLNFKVSPSI